MAKRSDAAIGQALSGLDGWSGDGSEIVREFQFRDFVEALGFIAQVGLLAERANHHPNLSNVYNRVTIALSTHDEGAIPERDVRLAPEITRRAGAGRAVRRAGGRTGGDGGRVRRAAARTRERGRTGRTLPDRRLRGRRA